MIAIGQDLAGYKIEGELGQGGMGIVYKAFDPSLNRMVAIKVIRSELSANRGFRARFDRERKAHANLDHPNIVDIRSSGECEHGLYVVMKFIDGPSLWQLLDNGPLSPEAALAVLGPVGQALDFAHRKGPIHRDLKPQNILLDSEARPYLTDFGLAWVPGQSRITTTGAFMGTTAYASPEQLRGAVPSCKSDIYSLACVLFECLTGRTPFNHDSQLAIALAHTADDRPRPTAANPELPYAIDEVVCRGMAREPEQRFRSAGALIEAAAGALRVSPTSPQLSAELGLDASRPAVASVSRTREFNEEAETHARGRADAHGWSWPALAIATAVLAGGSFLLGRGGGDAPASVLTNSKQAGHLLLRFSDDWEPVESAPKIPGLELEKPLFLRQRGEPESLSAGMVQASGKLLIPHSLTRKLAVRPRQQSVVRMGDGEAYRYSELRLAGHHQPFDLYVMPTTAGVATAVCQHRGEPAVTSACGQIATTLSLRDSRAYDLGPSTRYAKVLNRVLGDLSDRWEAELRSFDRDTTPAAQALTATQLGQAFGDAARRLMGLEVTPQSAPGNAAVVRALDRTAGAYRQLAAAASTANEADFDRARSSVRRAKAEVIRSVRRLRRLGYETN